MAKKPQIETISKNAWHIAQEWSASIANSALPLHLNALAKSHGVRGIRFSPLLSDAGLEKDGNGYEIVINTDAFGGYQDGTIFSVDNDSWSDLDLALRFRIAHEVAHLVFLEAAEKDRQIDTFVKNERAVENGCNILARILLLPRPHLLREIGNRFLEPDHIKRLMSSFRVTPEVFVRRFHLSDLTAPFTDERGIIILADNRSGVLWIKACHIIGGLARDRFDSAFQRQGLVNKKLERMSLSDDYRQCKWALENQRFSKIMLSRSNDVESLIRKNESGQLELEVEWGEGNVIPCKIQFCRTMEGSFNSLISIQIMGNIRTIGHPMLL